MSTEPHRDARSLAPLPPRPRAPTQAAWDAMTPAEREAVVDALPTYIPRDYLSSPPEGDDHVDAAVGTRDTLRMFYERTGRKLYVGAGVSVFYPNEDSFAPDVIAVEEWPCPDLVDTPVGAKLREESGPCLVESVVSFQRISKPKQYVWPGWVTAASGRSPRTWT